MKNLYLSLLLASTLSFSAPAQSASQSSEPAGLGFWGTIFSYTPPALLSGIGCFVFAKISTQTKKVHAGAAEVPHFFGGLLFWNALGKYVYDSDAVSADWNDFVYGMTGPTKPATPVPSYSEDDLNADALTLNDLQDQPWPDEPAYPTFAVSSEVEIGKAWPILRQAPKGFHVSVGSERSFRGASMANATGLIIVDISTKIKRFAEINRELLHAETLSEYRRLRFEASLADWEQFQRSYQSEKILTGDDYKWWQDNVAGNTYEYFSHWGAELKQEIFPGDVGKTVEYCFVITKSQNPKTKSITEMIDFETGNYVYDEALFQRLHALALAKKIYIIPINLRHHAAVSQLTKAISASGQKIGSIDLDNAFYSTYMGPSDYFKTVSELRKAASPSAILLAMAGFETHRCLDLTQHAYAGFSLKYALTNERIFDLERYFHNIHPYWLNSQGAKLYDDKNPLPYLEPWHWYVSKHLPQ